MSGSVPPATPARARRWVIWLPLALFAAVLALAVWGLMRPTNNTVPSRLIGRPLPAFSLPAAVAERPGIAAGDFARGKPRLLNVFASWCIPCAAEAPHLASLSAAGADIVGVAVRDRRPDVQEFLRRYGNPYSQIGADDLSRVQLAIGSSGVPETFVIDGRGVIRYQHIGDIRPDDVPILLSKLREAGQ